MSNQSLKWKPTRLSSGRYFYKSGSDESSYTSSTNVKNAFPESQTGVSCDFESHDNKVSKWIGSKVIIIQNQSSIKCVEKQ